MVRVNRTKLLRWTMNRTLGNLYNGWSWMFIGEGYTPFTGNGKVIRFTRKSTGEYINVFVSEKQVAPELYNNNQLYAEAYIDAFLDNN